MRLTCVGRRVICRIPIKKICEIDCFSYPCPTIVRDPDPMVRGVPSLSRVPPAASRSRSALVVVRRLSCALCALHGCPRLTLRLCAMPVSLSVSPPPPRRTSRLHTPPSRPSLRTRAYASHYFVSSPLCCSRHLPATQLPKPPPPLRALSPSCHSPTKSARGCRGAPSAAPPPALDPWRSAART